MEKRSKELQADQLKNQLAVFKQIEGEKLQNRGHWFKVVQEIGTLGRRAVPAVGARRLLLRGMEHTKSSFKRQLEEGQRRGKLCPLQIQK